MKRLALPLAAVLLLAGLSAPSSAGELKPGQSTFTALEPVRLLDTRTTGAPVGPGGTVDLVVADGVGVPQGATAVVLNVTATGATAATDVRAYPTPLGDEAPPTVSNLNAVAGSTVANLVHVKVGAGGAVRLRNASGSVHLIADLSGYFAEQAGAMYVGVEPRRLMDTRDEGAPLAGDEIRHLPVAGVGNRAPAEATAVVLTVTAVDATRTTDIRVWPRRDAAPPLVSNLNPPPGRPVAASVVVGVGDQGEVSLRSSTGTVHVVVDLAGWYLPTTDGSAFHPVAPTRLTDTRTTGTPVGPGGVLDVQVAGAGTVPFPATAVVLNVTAVEATATTDVRAFPTPVGSAVPLASSLNVVRGETRPNAVVATVGRDGSVRLRNSAGSVHLVVDLAGWFAPTGDGWDISWPQCTAAGATTSRLPVGGAFAVVGLTRSRPFTDNECFAAQWEWASSLPGEPAVYINVNAPGPRDTVDGRIWAEVCGPGTPTSTCAMQYGERIAAYVLPRLPTTPKGGRPMVWLDVEGPYTNGPFWQTGYAGAVAVNRGVIQGLVDGLRRAGYRIGTYSDRGSVADPNNDWRAIVGNWRLLQMQNWVFRSPDAEPRTICGPEHSFSGGPVVMAQVQPATNPGVSYDVNGLCP